MTESVFGRKCVIYGVSNNVEMHHLRKVADVRGKYISGNPPTFKQF